ncbi:MAG: YbjQ family protein, partial [Cyanobacteria bacterium]|nr:YbjQ family protein [Cyanobacteriota bacterium]
MAIITGLSGNELYCLREKGFAPGDLVIGNSVFALGVVGSFTSGLRTIGGGEIHEFTSIIKEGRALSYMRMVEEARRHHGDGVTGVTSQLIFHDTNIEYLSIGSTIHRTNDEPAHAEDHVFSTAANGQELYCQLDCGFRPVQFVFGNVAYSIGLGGGVKGAL